jgi:hypothetical protein
MTKAQKHSAEWSDFFLPECFSLLQNLNELLQNGQISFCKNIYLRCRRISAKMLKNFQLVYRLLYKEAVHPLF